MKLPSYLNHPGVVLVRRVLAELAIGLALGWFALMLLELIRPTLTSAQLNLNNLLAFTVLLWLVGTPAPGSPRRPYISAATSAILVVGISLVLGQGSAVPVWFRYLAGVATFAVWLLSAQPVESVSKK